jgi:SAM-dependent methyltransferase
MRKDEWKDYVLEYDFTDFPKDLRVLDVGCGDGTQLRELHQGGCVAIGIEPDWRSLVTCQAGRLRVIQGTAEELPIKSASVDGLVCRVVIPYTDEARAVSEISRVLRPGAVGHFSDLGAGYYLRYLLCGPTWKFRFYGLRTLLNTWLYALTGRRLPGFLGDTLYQTRRRIEASYRTNGMRLLHEIPSPTFLGLPVFLYHSLEKVAI